VGALHWLVVIPVYFFGAISWYALLDSAARLVRADVGPERLAGAAVLASIASVVVVLASGLVGLDDLRLLPLLGLGLASFALAGADAALARAMPLASDEEPGRRRATDPQVL
jgi:hypothetical protein